MHTEVTESIGKLTLFYSKPSFELVTYHHHHVFGHLSEGVWHRATGSRTAEVSILACHVLAGTTWASCLTSQCLCVFIYESTYFIGLY